MTSSLKYTPVVLAHHCPFKSLPNGKLSVSRLTFLWDRVAHISYSKGPAQTSKWKTLQKLILSYFHNAIHVLTQLTDRNMIVLALTETAKLVPHIANSRKSVKLYLKVYLISSACITLGQLADVSLCHRHVWTSGRVQRTMFGLQHSSRSAVSHRSQTSR